jgi:hypothetical protein
VPVLLLQHGEVVADGVLHDLRLRTLGLVAVDLVVEGGVREVDGADRRVDALEPQVLVDERPDPRRRVGEEQAPRVLTRAEVAAAPRIRAEGDGPRTARPPSPHPARRRRASITTPHSRRRARGLRRRGGGSAAAAPQGPSGRVGTSRRRRSGSGCARRAVPAQARGGGGLLVGRAPRRDQPRLRRARAGERLTSAKYRVLAKQPPPNQAAPGDREEARDRLRAHGP